jgi:transposase
MRGTDERSGGLFNYVDLEARVRADHPLRAIGSIVNDALRDLAPDFGALYSTIGRPSVAPERLLRAMLLQAFYSVRSERQADGAARHRPTTGQWSGAGHIAIEAIHMASRSEGRPFCGRLLGRKC